MKLKLISRTFFLLSVLFILFSACKKYPENVVLLKRIKKIKFFDNVKLTAYTVNGIDSLALLNSYFGSEVPDKNIDHTYFQATEFDNKEYGGLFQFTYPTGVNKIELSVEYIKNKKHINISFGRFGSWDTSAFRRNLFVDNTTSWQIIKLDPKATRKIKKTVKGNTYELQFDKN